ncbi:hypothetical protein HMI55_007151, partial [Coelomomyces lativittatus]
LPKQFNTTEAFHSSILQSDLNASYYFWMLDTKFAVIILHIFDNHHGFPLYT